MSEKTRPEDALRLLFDLLDDDLFEMSEEELDAEIRATTGEDPQVIVARMRQRIDDLLKNEAKQ